ncbi:hypothetical protein [Hoylesella oralis]|uniref:hypothetical protein n=1 Tax=Hoylesella oralis TaxID=28134 RepID=UPI0028E47FDA|nr:hypothetical protein [Hoylesella oralis]
MNKEQNKKQVYVRPETKVLGVATEQHLLEFSGGHNDAGNDNDPMHAKGVNFFDEEETIGTTFYSKNPWEE